MVETLHIGALPKWNRNSLKSACVAGDVVASWSLTQEVAGSSPFDDR